MSLHVLGVALPIADRLRSDYLGQVAGVHERVVNLRGPDGRLLVLHGSDVAWTPFSVRVSPTPVPMPWRPDAGRWPLGRPVHRDKLSMAPWLELWDPSLPEGPVGPDDALPCELIIPLLRQELASFGRGTLARVLLGTGPVDTPLAHRFQEALRLVRKALREPAQDRAEAGIRQSVSRLVGLGEGLTPSGDDLLVGLLAGLRRMATLTGHQRAQQQWQAWREAVRRALAATCDATTDVSREFLRYAAEGQFAEPLKALASSVAAPRGDSQHSAGAPAPVDRFAAALDPDADAACSVVRQRIRRALETGATSGSDGVAGLLLALEAAVSWRG